MLSVCNCGWVSVSLCVKSGASFISSVVWKFQWKGQKQKHLDGIEKLIFSP